jgi:hypothetical protein
MWATHILLQTEQIALRSAIYFLYCFGWKSPTPDANFKCDQSHPKDEEIILQHSQQGIEHRYKIRGSCHDLLDLKQYAPHLMHLSHPRLWWKTRRNAA